MVDTTDSKVRYYSYLRIQKPFDILLLAVLKKYATVVKLVDTGDSKSPASNSVAVRVRSVVPQ